MEKHITAEKLDGNYLTMMFYGCLGMFIDVIWMFIDVICILCGCYVHVIWMFMGDGIYDI